MKLLRRIGIALLITALCLIALRLSSRTPLQSAAAYSQAFYSSDGALLRLTLARDEQYRVWTPLSAMNPRVAEAVLLYEDRWYRWHVGVNPVSLLRGAWESYAGDSRRGASTISMQLARRLYRMDSRSPAGKLKQAAAALWLEARYSKHDILEAYLNLAPYGSNIEGVGAASLIYFGKRAADLSLPEALALAVIPQNPNRRGTQVSAMQADAWPLALSAARGRLWGIWQRSHEPSAKDATYAAELALPLKLRSSKQLPFLAPHAVQTVAALPATAVASSEISLSLHAPSQAALERAVQQFITNRKPQGVHNAAALLIDAPTGQVRAWVGSANYFDAAINGQVNATSAKRSPGSTLKPFIYGLGLDQGLLHPRSVLKDAPTSFGWYTPENFDGRFEGPITAQDALIKSRNIPAVSVASRLNNPNLYGFMRQAGVSKMASESHYGLALALGGGEVSMEELGGMYAMLANGGEHTRLSYLAGAPSEATQTLLSPEAAFVTLEMLKANPRPDTGQPAFPPVAWKTGTSWGFRDAWTAGVFGSSVLVVWVGNFDGTPNPAFIGVQTAAPLFFSIVDSLRSQGLEVATQAVISSKPAPRNLSRVPVCAASGDLPNEFCKDKALTWFIPGKSPIKVSTLHRLVHLDPGSGRALCERSATTREEVFEYWSSDMLQLFAQAGMPRRVPPAAPRCGAALVQSQARAEGDAPQIVSPLRGANYVMRLAQPTPLTLKANAARQGTLYWFADTAFVGTTLAGKALEWTPARAGRVLLAAVDEQGATDTREVMVEYAP